MKMKSPFSNHVFLKIVSICISILLWSYVSFVLGAKVINTSVFPLQLKGLNPTYEVTLSEEQIEITLEAPKNIFDSLRKNISVMLDIADLEPGSYKIKPSINAPDDIHIISNSPEYITVTLDVLKTQEYTVKAILSGNLQSGNIAGEPVITPTKVAISGPEKELSTIQQVVVEIDISNASDSIFSLSKVLALDDQGNPLSKVHIEPETVQVTIPVISTDISKLLPIVPTVVGRPEGRILEITTDPIFVMVSGSIETMKSLMVLKTEEISIEGVNETIERQVQILVPKGANIPQNKATVLIRIKIEPNSSRLFEGINVSILNLPFQLESFLENPAINVRVYGLQSQLDKLQSIEVYIDVKNLSPGTYTLPILYTNLPENIIAQAFPSQITVKLIKNELKE